ncbi:hypothetical protein PCE1_003031 [Barthelona sp. PCE]
MYSTIFNLQRCKNSANKLFSIDFSFCIELQFFHVVNSKVLKIHEVTVQRRLGIFAAVVRDTDMLCLDENGMNHFNFASQDCVHYGGFKRLVKFPHTNTYYAHFIHDGEHVIVDVDNELIILNVVYSWDLAEFFRGEHSYHNVVEVYNHPIYKDIITIGNSMFLIGSVNHSAFASPISYDIPSEMLLAYAYYVDDELYLVSRQNQTLKITKQGYVFDTALSPPGKTLYVGSLLHNVLGHTQTVRLQVKYVPPTTLLTLTRCMYFSCSSQREVPVMRTYGCSIYLAPWLNTLHIFRADPCFNNEIVENYKNALVHVNKDSYIRIRETFTEVVHTSSNRVLCSTVFEDAKDMMIVGNEYGIIGVRDNTAISCDGTVCNEVMSVRFIGNICHLYLTKGIVWWVFKDGTVVDTANYFLESTGLFFNVNIHNPDMVYLEVFDEDGRLCIFIVYNMWEEGVIAFPLFEYCGIIGSPVVEFLDKYHLLYLDKVYLCNGEDLIEVLCDIPMDSTYNSMKFMYYQGEAGVLYRVHSLVEDFEFVYDVLKFNAEEANFSHEIMRINLLHFVRNADIVYRNGFLHFRMLS